MKHHKISHIASLTCLGVLLAALPGCLATSQEVQHLDTRVTTVERAVGLRPAADPAPPVAVAPAADPKTGKEKQGFTTYVLPDKVKGQMTRLPSGDPQVDTAAALAPPQPGGAPAPMAPPQPGDALAINAPLPVEAPPAELELAAPQPKAPPQASESAAYQKGQSLLKQKRYPEAAAVFQQMLHQTPQGKLAPNAAYWLGECYYATGNFNAALAEFKSCAQTYPHSPKAPDALFKAAYCLNKLGDGPGAMAQLEQLLTAYPQSSSADAVRTGRVRF